MTTLSVAQARANFSKLVESASVTHERFEITRNGSRAAVLLGADDYDALLETLAILGDAETLALVRQGLHEVSQGDTVTADDIREALAAGGRMAR